MNDKQKLIKEIEKMELQLHRAEQESDAWNSGKYKNSSNADVSKIYVDSLRKSIAKLRQQRKEEK